MTVSKSSRRRLEVIPLEEFLRSPPAGFSVEKIGGSDFLVSSDPESSLVLIDDIDGCSERVLFQNSLGRWGNTFGYLWLVRVDPSVFPWCEWCFSYHSKVKMKNLWEYSSTRKSLLSKRIYLVASTCLQGYTKTNCGARGGLIMQKSVHQLLNLHTRITCWQLFCSHQAKRPVYWGPSKKIIYKYKW